MANAASNENDLFRSRRGGERQRTKQSNTKEKSFHRKGEKESDDAFEHQTTRESALDRLVSSQVNGVGANAPNAADDGQNYFNSLILMSLNSTTMGGPAWI